MNRDRYIAESELIINPDGSIFHLHLKPEDVCETILLVGDPSRVEVVASLFDTVTLRRESREFSVAKGLYGSKEYMVLSTGIGCGNIDIAITELDALVNVDFETRTVKKQLTKLTFIRMGTCGAVQGDKRIGDLLLSAYTLGIGSLVHFYRGVESVCDAELESNFVEHMGWDAPLASPYGVKAPSGLRELFKDVASEGITVTAPGFYAPQGRMVRVEPKFDNFVSDLSRFSYNGYNIENIEMESAPLAALSAMLGHDAITICVVIAQREKQSANSSYGEFIEKMIKSVLECSSQKNN